MDGSKRIVVFKMNLFSVINFIFKISVISLILQPHSVLVFQDLTWNCLADSLLSGFGFLWGFFPCHCRILYVLNFGGKLLS